MFALAHGHSDRLGRIIFVLLNGSVVGLALGFIFSWLPLILLSGSALIAAAWLFAYDFTRMLRMRRRKVLDVSQYHSIAALAYLSLLMPLGIVVTLFGEQAPFPQLTSFP